MSNSVIVIKHKVHESGTSKGQTGPHFHYLSDSKQGSIQPAFLLQDIAPLRLKG